jgi:hypothetical protein
MPEIPITLQVAIAIAALVISIFVARRQSRVALQNLRLQRDNAIILWSNRALDHLCSAEMILKQEYRSVMSQAEYEKARLATMRNISSCIDQGRLFFPNLHHPTKGQDKPAAFRGSRHPVLDCLVFSHDLLGQAGHHQDIHAVETGRNEVVRFRREFISHVQSELDPHGLVRFLNKHLADKAKVKPPKSL